MLWHWESADRDKKCLREERIRKLLSEAAEKYKYLFHTPEIQKMRQEYGKYCFGLHSLLYPGTVRCGECPKKIPEKCLHIRSGVQRKIGEIVFQENKEKLNPNETISKQDLFGSLFFIGLVGWILVSFCLFFFYGTLVSLAASIGSIIVAKIIEKIYGLCFK